MDVSEGIISKIIERSGASAQAISTHLLNLQSIEDAIRNLHRTMREEDQRYKKSIKDLEMEIEATRKRCPHFETKYHGDAAGGSDSYTTCNLCGAIL